MVTSLNSQNEVGTKVVELQVRRRGLRVTWGWGGAGRARRSVSGPQVPLMKCSKQVLDGQGGLACCGSWGCRVRYDWVTELNFPSVKIIFVTCILYWDSKVTVEFLSMSMSSYGKKKWTKNTSLNVFWEQSLESKIIKAKEQSLWVRPSAAKLFFKGLNKCLHAQ